MDRDKTQQLPANWFIPFPTSQPEPRRRYPRTAESMAVTTRIAVVSDR